jgi:hypothetical protein
MSADDRTCSGCCTRLVPAACCPLSKHKTVFLVEGFSLEERLHEELNDLPPAEYEELNINADNSRTLAAR